MDNLSFEAYVRKEENRQRKQKLLNFETHDARQVWLSEAYRRWCATASPMTAVEPTNAAELKAISAVSLVSEAEGAEFLSQLRNGKRLSTGELTCCEGQFSPEEEMMQTLSFVELNLLFAHYFVNDEFMASIALKLKPTVDTLRNTAAVTPMFRHINTLYELFCLRRLMKRWSQIPEVARNKACTATREISGHYEGSVAFDALVAALSPTPTPDDIPALLSRLEGAAKAVPITFESSATALQKRCPFAKFTLAPRPPMKKSVSCSVSVERENRNGGGGDQRLDREDSLEDILTPEAKRLAGQKANRTSDDFEDLVRATRGHAPEGKKSRFELVAPEAATVSARQRGGMVSAVPAAVPTQARVHPHPCRSKYHERFSTPDKHGSDACSFCNVCHMMEFLFNGCRRDCCWKHYPTPKKIAFNLKRFPGILTEAKLRLENMQRGIYPDPTEI